MNPVPSHVRDDRRRPLARQSCLARRVSRWVGVVVVAHATRAIPAGAQWVTTHEQHYLPGAFNWQFRQHYANADRLFNAFDFGHAILYETLLTQRSPVEALERRWYDRLTKDILVRPPRVPLEEAAVEVTYAKLVPEAKAMFDWAHLLHRQIYDVWADERLTPTQRDTAVADLLRYYRSRRDLAFSAKPKTMELMQEQPYSVAFRRDYPRFNGLIWAYHWLQVGLYEPLLTAASAADRKAGVTAAVGRFWQMLESPSRSMPHVMPMTAAVAPEFSRRYPEAAIIFDNLHSMHDVVSDILANPSVPHARKRAELLLAARRYRDDTSFVMTEAAWRTTARHMGVENMGGLAVGFEAALPTPTVTYGAVMTHDPRTGEMTGFKYGESIAGANTHAGHVMPAAADSAVQRAPAGHEGHVMPGPQPGRDSLEVAATVTRFHAALAAGDSTAVMALLSDDAVILEGGGVETRPQYRAGHLMGDIAFARAVPSTRGTITVKVLGDAAWASSTSTTEGTYRDRQINSSGAELVVLSREGSAWKIRAIHWSSRARRPQGG